MTIYQAYARLQDGELVTGGLLAANKREAVRIAVARVKFIYGPGSRIVRIVPVIKADLKYIKNTRLDKLLTEFEQLAWVHFLYAEHIGKLIKLVGDVIALMKEQQNQRNQNDPPN